MDYETLWKEFAQRMLNASEFGVSKMVNIDEVIHLMSVYEQHFMKLAKQLEADAKQSEELEAMGLTPA